MAFLANILRSVIPTLGGLVTKAIPFLGRTIANVGRSLIPSGITAGTSYLMNKFGAPPDLTQQVVSASQNLGQQFIANKFADAVSSGSGQLGSLIQNAVNKRASGGIDNSALLLNNINRMASFMGSPGNLSILRDGITGQHMGTPDGQQVIINRLLNPIADLPQNATDVQNSTQQQ